MGTRADFYIGVGKNAEWLGSVAWDGYEWDYDPTHPVMKAETEEEFREAVQQIAKDRDDWTAPEDGWPWPWDDSSLTDYIYAFVDGTVKVFVGDEMDVEWPDMSMRRNLAYGLRSGLLQIEVK
ncbi:MAG: hypothetical protein D6706_10640 [Chloroflexi bacterium]|nr:MAG: hypothetical protein D6706_10640 [Chloroflexota bacterium]